MAKNAKTKPAITLRDGALKATVWKNPAKDGSFYSVRIARTYRDEQGGYHDSNSFSGAELLRVARLAEKAFDYAAELRAQARRGKTAD